MGRETGKPVKRRNHASKTTAQSSSHAKQIEDRLRRYLQTDVAISLSGKDQGQISVVFYSNDDLERILELIVGSVGDSL
jgi:hypothetical protein